MSDFERKIPPLPKRKPFEYWPEAINEDVKSFIRNNETPMEHFYRDTKGNATIGIGAMIPNAESARKLPLYLFSDTRKPLRPATEDEKVDAYNRVMQEPKGLEAYKYDPYEDTRLPNLRLQQPDMEFMLEQRLREGAKHLHGEFPDFPSYPAQARKALQDMEFQIGPTKFKEQTWKELFPAVRSRDWLRAAEQSRRDIHGNEKKNEDDLRNINTKNYFIEADRIERQRKPR